MKFTYEIVPVGTTPTWAKENTQDFTVPVAVGDKIKRGGLGTDLKRVIAVEHYPEITVLYVE